MTECVKWGGRHRKWDGRPVASNGKTYAYRELWEQDRGPLEGKILHHRCLNKWCVNLDHLEALTQSEHLKEHGLPGDWGQADKQECPAGHPYDEDNTYTYETKDGSTERHCRKCRRATKKRYRERQKIKK